MKIIIIFLIVSLSSCGVSRISQCEGKYSTGHMGMMGENIFVFKDGNQFYYSDRLYYSEGTFVWIDSKSIKLFSKPMGFGIPYKGSLFHINLSDKIVIFKGSKLYFEGFILKKVKESS